MFIMSQKKVKRGTLSGLPTETILEKMISIKFADKMRDSQQKEVIKSPLYSLCYALGIKYRPKRLKFVRKYWKLKVDNIREHYMDFYLHRIIAWRV